MPHAMVIGGGPAGSVVSVALARRGWDVTLLEQHRFPRDKVCGECVSALGLEVLARLGLRDAVERCEPVRLRRSALIGPAGEAATFDLPREMWGIPRDVFDDQLLSAARGAGATVLQPHRCEHVEGGVCPVVRARDLETNEVQAYSPNYVLVADGKAALGVERPGATGDFGLKTHFAGVGAPRDTVLLAAANGHYVGVAAVTPGTWNVAMSVPRDRLKRCEGSGDRVLDLARRENATLDAMFARAHRLGEWLAAPLPRFGVARQWPRRVIPIGNAAAAVEPIGGEGMGLAMRSAELAADALADAESRSDEPDVARLRNEYVKLWRRRRFSCRAAAMLLSHPALAPAAMSLASNGPVARMAMRWMGK